MAKLNGVKTLDMVNGEITKVAYDGAEYSIVNEASAPPKVGDIYLAKQSRREFTSGNFYQIEAVNGDIVYSEGDDGIFKARYTHNASPNGVALERFVKVADASKPEVKAPVLKAGDYVKFTENQIGIIGGDLYEIIERYEVIGLVDKDGDFRHGGVFGDEYEIVPADDAKWAKIGRKVGEFKKGDIVRIIEEIGSGFIEGTLGVVAKDCNDGENSPLVKAYAADEGEIDSYYAEVELVAPVESTLI